MTNTEGLSIPCNAQVSEIISHALWMQKEGYRRSTIESAVSSLKGIANRTNLLDPESVKRYLGTAQLTENRKEALTVRLARFYKYKGIAWTAPRYRRIEKLPFIPLESEVDQLISGCGRRQACFLRLLKETGMRPGEAWQLQWKDVDTERRMVSVTPEKNSNPRPLKISDQLIAIMNMMPRLGSYVFHETKADPITSLVYFRRVFERRRKRVAERLQNPRLELISFKTLRHFKATTEYHKTKDILHVMQLLGHKNIRNTLVYTHLVNFQSDDYVCKVAKTVEEAKALVESGFDYVTDVEGCKLFRKRK
jgi:integrase